MDINISVSFIRNHIYLFGLPIKNTDSTETEAEPVRRRNTRMAFRKKKGYGKTEIENYLIAFRKKLNFFFLFAPKKI